MNLTDYQWSHNPRGMHDPGDNHARWDEWQLGWMKVVFPDNQGVNWSAHALEKGMTPIFRPFRSEFSGVPMDETLQQLYQEYINVGVKWFEFYNEPNVGYEWRPGVDIFPTNLELISPLCENWLLWAEWIINRGGYPGFIALTETSESWGDTAAWMRSLLQYMADNHYERFRAIISNGMWLPTHAYIFNHWYQERPGNPAQARSAGEVNYREGGWHFEYPYDPISQAGDPGRTVWGGTPLSPLGDVHGLIACGQAWLERLQDMFGLGAVPVIGTEGGLWPLPQPGQLRQMDTRYPGFTWESHAHATVAMFDWTAREAPPWFWGLALWKWDHYYDPSGGGPMPAAFLLDQTSPVYKDVSALDSGGFAAPPPADLVIEPPGPGPVHGEPTYHFIVLAPGIDEEWFFTVGRFYWDRFRPTLMTVHEFINFLPKDTSLAVTILTTPDLVDLMNEQIARRWPNVYMDFVVGGEAREIEEILNSRVAVGRRFG